MTLAEFNRDELPAVDDVQAVGARIEQTYHAITALHDLCDEAISSAPGDAITQFVLMREVLRSVARDMENCAEILQGDPGGFGFFASHYGEV